MVNIATVFPSNYLRADDLNDSPKLATIRGIGMVTLGDEEKLCISFDEYDKGLILNKTNATNIASFIGPETDAWIGRQIVMVPAMVDYQGRSVEAIRVRAPKAKAAPIAQTPVANEHKIAQQLNDEVPF